MHYVHEAGNVVPLAQATRQGPITLTASVGANDLMNAKGRYDVDRDPLWNGEAEKPTGPGFTKEEIAFYQVDHLGTPQELTDHEGGIAWSAQYKAWGQAREVISEAARKAGIANPIRFQGQYLDEETGLHYNRHRYYDPHAGKFVSSDPIGLLAGSNLHEYAPSPTDWIDPLGLQRLGGGRNGGMQRPAAGACCKCGPRGAPGPQEYGPFHRKESPTQPPERAREMEQSRTLAGGAARINAGGAVRVNAYSGPLPDGERGVEFYTTAKPTSSIPNGYTFWHPGQGGCTENVATRRFQSE